MNTSMSWIKMYVPDLDVTAQEYTDAMTLSGTKVEGFEKLDADLDKIVIGQIEKIEKHPDAEKLYRSSQVRRMSKKEIKYRSFWTADVLPEDMTDRRLLVGSKSKKENSEV